MLKHHCRQFTSKHENLKAEFESNADELVALTNKYQLQTTDFELVKKQLNELAEINRQQAVQINSQKNDLALTMGNYYDGVLNIDKSTSKNIPKKG